MAVVLLICALIISIIFYGTVAGVSNLNIENTKITSQKVDESLYDLKRTNICRKLSIWHEYTRLSANYL